MNQNNKLKRIQDFPGFNETPLDFKLFVKYWINNGSNIINPNEEHSLIVIKYKKHTPFDVDPITDIK